LSQRIRFLQIKYKFADLQFSDLSVESELNELMALARRAHEVTLITATSTRLCASKAMTVQGLSLEPVFLRKNVRILSWLLFQMIVFWRLLQTIHRRDVLVLDYSVVPVLYPLLALRRLLSHYPVLVLRVTSNPVETEGSVRSWALCLFWIISLKLAGGLFDRIYFITPMMGWEFSRVLKLPSSKIGTWPSTVNTRLFDPRSPQLSSRIRSLRREFALSGRMVVLHHGVLSKARGIMETVEAFALLKKRSVKAILFLLGDGPARAELRKYIRSNDLEEYVRIHGPVPYSDVPMFIATCDVGIVPLPNNSWWRHQCPTKLLEYLAMNKPVIVSDLPGHRWVLGNAPIAQYLKGTGAEEIANGLTKAMKNFEIFSRRQGRRISYAFSGERVAQMLEQDVLLALRGHRGTRIAADC